MISNSLSLNYIFFIEKKKNLLKRHTKMSVLSQALRILEGFMKHIDNITDIKRQSVGGQEVGGVRRAAMRRN